MDLSYRFDRDTIDRAAVTAIPTELAVLMVGVAARQAASPTARRQAQIDWTHPGAGLFAPAHGAFNAEVEAALMRQDASLTGRKEP